MRSELFWPASLVLGGSLNFLFQYLLTQAAGRAQGDLALRLTDVRARFESRNLWALLSCIVGALWFFQELV